MRFTFRPSAYAIASSWMCYVLLATNRNTGFNVGAQARSIPDSVSPVTQALVPNAIKFLTVALAPFLPFVVQAP